MRSPNKTVWSPKCEKSHFSLYRKRPVSPKYNKNVFIDHTPPGTAGRPTGAPPDSLMDYREREGKEGEGNGKRRREKGRGETGKEGRGGLTP